MQENSANITNDFPVHYKKQSETCVILMISLLPYLDFLFYSPVPESEGRIRLSVFKRNAAHFVFALQTSFYHYLSQTEDNLTALKTRECSPGLVAPLMRIVSDKGSLALHDDRHASMC